MPLTRRRTLADTRSLSTFIDTQAVDLAARKAAYQRTLFARGDMILSSVRPPTTGTLGITPGPTPIVAPTTYGYPMVGINPYDTARLDLSGTATAACGFLPAGRLRQACELAAGLIPGGGGGGGGGLVSTSCPDGQVGIPPACFDLQPGGGTQGGGLYVGGGEAVLGRFGAALQPAYRTTSVARCPRGAVLGLDGLCYNKSQLRRSDRKWIPGRKPLLTGGDLNAIARASRAAGKMKTQQKRLQKLGLLAKPKARQARLPAHTHPHHHHGGSHGES